MAQLFTNNARATITSSITADATSIVIDATKADLFPVATVGSGSIPSSDDWFKLTLQDSVGNVEIVAVRTRAAGSSLLSNVIRGYDGTTARAFTSGTVIGLRLTAEDVQTALAITSENNVFTGDNSFTGTNEFIGSQTFSGLTTFNDEIEFNDAPTAPTVSYGDNTTKLATTAFVQAALQALHPVGSIYINAGVNTNPATLFGFGTWVAFGAGRVMVGLNGSDSLFDALEETGGSKDAVVVSHSHTLSGTANNAGSHSHVTAFGYSNDHDYFGNGVSSFTYNGGGVTQNPYNYSSNAAGEHQHTLSGTADTAGSSGTNANLQPYITVAMWKRTA
jgi:hypothetical protein